MLLLATVLAAGLRLYHLESAGFWVDELNTVRVCADISTMKRSKVLGYLPTYLSLKLAGVRIESLASDHPEHWMALGVTERNTRIASCLIGILTVPIIGWCGRRMLGSRESMVLMILLAASVWHIQWSQAARFYTQQFLFYNLALISYFLATERRSLIQLLLAVLCIVLAFLSQPPALIVCAVIGAYGAYLIATRQAGRLRWIGPLGVLLALSICAVVLKFDVNLAPDDWRKFLHRPYQTPRKLILGVVYMIGFPLAIFAVLSALSLFGRRFRLTLFLALGAVLPLIAFAVLAQLNVYVSVRYCLISLYCWLALAALGCVHAYDALRAVVGRPLASAPAAVLLGTMALMDYGYFTTGFGFHPRWRDALAYVRERRLPGEKVVCSPTLIAKYYLEDGAVKDGPKRPEDLSLLGGSTWIVAEVEDTIRGRVRGWLDGTVALRAHYQISVVQPQSTVRVYYHSVMDSQAGPAQGAARPAD